MNIKPKWKIFAIRQSFSDDSTCEEALALYGALEQASTGSEVEAVIERYGAIPWQPLEDMRPRDFRDQLTGLALHAQDIEGTPDVYVVVHKGCVRYVSSTEDITATVVDTDGHHYDDDEDGMQKEALKTAESLVRYW